MRSAGWLLVATVLLLPAQAQIPLPGQDAIRFEAWSDSSSAQPGGVVELKVKAELEPGWHVYAESMPHMGLGPLPTTFTITAPPGAELVSVKADRDPELKFEEAFQLQTQYYEGEVVWTLRVRLPQELPEAFEVVGSVRYQICTETQCLPPATFEFSVPFTTATGTASVAEEPEGMAEAGTGQVRDIASALAFGFLAGLILNVMPCVLPVLSLKIYGFLQQSSVDPFRTKMLALTFAAGVITVFLILAAICSSLSYGWGQQFQSRTFIVAMVGLVVAFAMGLFEVYVIRVPGFVSRLEGELAHEETYPASFAKGMLATVLATPCTGPFLGAVLTYAVQQPAPVVFSVFAMIGVGMASPYVVLAWFPAWTKLLPKPGEWMNVVKEAMGFLLLGTAIWLIWSRRHDGVFVTWTVAFALCVAFACWIYGRMATATAPAWRRAAGAILAATTVAIGWMQLVVAQGILESSATSDRTVADHRLRLEEFDREAVEASISKGQWLAYRRDLLDRLLREGYSVVVDWTADW